MGVRCALSSSVTGNACDRCMASQSFQYSPPIGFFSCADGYTNAPGAMAAGHDVHQGNFTLIEAKRFCNTSSLCTGFTMKAPMTSIVDNQEYPTFFKSARGMNADAQWSSFFKVMFYNSWLYR